jgi:hypothetical protein
MIFNFSTYANISDLKNLFTKDFLISTASTGCMPKGIKVDPIGSSLYVAEMCGKFDPSTKKQIASASIFDLSKRSLVKTLKTPKGATQDGILGNTEVTFSLDEQWGLISRAEGDSNSEIFKNFGLLNVVNIETQKIAKYIPLYGSGSKIIATRPYLKADSKREQIIYVANYFSDNISVVEISKIKDNGNVDGSESFMKLINLNTNYKNPRSSGYLIAPRGIAFSSDGKYAFVLASETGSLIVVDAVKHLQIAELAPISSKTTGRELNLRHIVVSNSGETAYLSHMRGNAISRINLSKLIETIDALPRKGKDVTLPESLWDELLIPFKTAKGKEKILILEDYPVDHPNFSGKKWLFSHPNTIVLDPLRNRYLFVSSRTTTNSDDSRVDPKIMGKIDIVDLKNDKLVFSLVGGVQPTALEVSSDSKMLISAGLINDMLYFFDLKKIIDLYEK